MLQLKNHKLAKIVQRENYEQERANKLIEDLKETAQKIAVVFVRPSPIMEVLTGIMIATMIYYSGTLINNNEIDINSFSLLFPIY